MCITDGVERGAGAAQRFVRSRLVSPGVSARGLEAAVVVAALITAAFTLTASTAGARESGMKSPSSTAASFRVGRPAVAQRRKLADLVTASVLVSLRNGSLYVSVTTANVGRGEAPVSTSRLYLSADRRRTGGALRIGKTLAVPALAPGKRSRGSLSLAQSALERLQARRALPPTVYVVVCADDLNRVREARLNNNCASSSTSIRLAIPQPLLPPPPPPSQPPPATAPTQPPGGGGGGG
jgi:hypothetical protein